MLNKFELKKKTYKKTWSNFFDLLLERKKIIEIPKMNDLCPVKNFIRPDKPHGCLYEKSLTETSIVCPHTKSVKYLS